MNKTYLCIYILLCIPYPLFTVEKPYAFFQEKPETPYEGGDLFYTLHCMLYALDGYDRGHYQGVAIDFHQGGFNYNPELGDNWWQYYFTGNTWGIAEDAQIVRVPDWHKYNMYMYARFDRSADDLHRLFKKYITVQPAIMQEVQAYTTHLAKQRPIIGIYYHSRSRVAYSQVMQAIKQARKRYKRAHIFLATGDYYLAALVSNKYGKHIHHSPYPLTKHPNEHLSAVSKRQLINCLILSTCDILIKTSDMLSSTVSICNPRIPVIALDQDRLEKE